MASKVSVGSSVFIVFVLSLDCIVAEAPVNCERTKSGQAQQGRWYLVKALTPVVHETSRCGSNNGHREDYALPRSRIVAIQCFNNVLYFQRRQI